MSSPIDAAETSPEHHAWEDRILAELDGRAGADERAELEAHLSGCPDCRSVQAEYRSILARLRDIDAPRTPAFWDELAGEIDDRVAAEAVPAAATKELASTATPVTPAGSAEPHASPAVVPLHRGWNAVAGGLVAACVGMLLLVGLYLRAPRDAAQPQAFTTPPAPGERVAPGEGVPLVDGADPREPAAGRGADEPAAAEGAEDPLAVLADPAWALDDLSADEAEELLQVLEASS